MRTGQYIVETRSVPRVDLYSYTVAGHPWVSQEWLTEVLMHLVAVRLGYVGNAVLFGLVGVATALAVYLMCRWNLMVVAPPLIITEDELRTGIRAIDEALEIADRYAATREI